MIKTMSVYAALVIMMAFAGGASAETTIAGGMTAEGGDAKAGKEKAEACFGCHGEDGVSIDPETFPHLAGQFAGYTFKQVLDYQLGNREDDTMGAMAGMVETREDLSDISAYFASLKPVKGEPSGSKAAKAGADIYQNGNKKLGNYAACVRCHGEKGRGQGNNALFPIISGQSKAYTIKQMQDFKAGTRANDPASMMAMVAKGMTDKEIEAIADYLSGL
ncbi:MAG: c-type cytochrome [Proteobacteria bacterium]|nr:c-type cytochrome [Pseudomonadota bacterium]